MKYEFYLCSIYDTMSTTVWIGTGYRRCMVVINLHFDILFYTLQRYKNVQQCTRMQQNGKSIRSQTF